MKVSKNFSREEFACKCGCGFSVVDVELLDILERVRVHFNSPVKINSACRCNEHNINVGGSIGSKHKLGIAADIVVLGVEPEVVHNFLDNHAPNRYGLGNYETFTHVDVRESKARF
jgi:uncharacterized protein YcbK (DUF882 family)